MGRPHKYREISKIRPKVNFYCPNGILISEMKKIFISEGEFEALRLRDYEHLKQTVAAKKMGVSQTTYSRIVRSAAEKVIKALIEGKGIVIQTHGYYEKCPNLVRQRQRIRIKMNQKSGRNISEKMNVAFRGFGCQNCGFEWTSQKLNDKICPECQSSKIYKLIKKLQSK